MAAALPLKTTQRPCRSRQTGRHVVYRLHAHIVITPKYRRNVMTEAVTAAIRESAEEVATRRGFTITAFETDNDHAHLWIDYPPKLSLSGIVGSLKTNSSKHVRSLNMPEVWAAIRGDHFWSPSYCVVSCGGAPLEVVKRYVENQGREPRAPGNPTFA